jgi:hypothetical protein
MPRACQIASSPSQILRQAIEIEGDIVDPI